MEECFTRGRESIMKVFSSLGMEGKKAYEEREMGMILRYLESWVNGTWLWYKLEKKGIWHDHDSPLSGAFNWALQFGEGEKGV